MKRKPTPQSPSPRRSPGESLELRRFSSKKRSRPQARAARGPVWLFGIHAVLAAIVNPRRRCRRLLVTAEARQPLEARLSELSGACPEIPRPAVTTREAIAALLPPGTVHQGVALEADPLPEPTVAEVLRAAAGRKHARVVVLDRVTDPHNVGAILRSAAAFGALAVIVTERHAPGETGTLAKSASGALDLIPLVRAKNLVRTLKEFKEAGFWCAGLDARAERPLAMAGLSGRVVLVLGAEDKGLRRLTRETCDLLVSLPMGEAVESLNVSVAAAIALYELARSQEEPAGP
ncbi:MAG: 23S rRNA (guanosine(2251)-2'-O)-methyltransferase RlmB [Alphaproteobacteria bacterium]